LSLMNRLSSMVETLPGVARRVLSTTTAPYGWGMLVTNHVLSGAVIGAVARRPAAAFALGVASHFALDTAPHWGRFSSQRQYLSVAVPDGLAGLAVIAAATALAPPGRRVAVLAGMAGAALPDLDKPSKLFFNRSPFPPAVDRFHVRIQREAPRRAHYEAAAAVLFGAVAFALMRAGEPDRSTT
jgi:hypothetical protein